MIAVVVDASVLVAELLRPRGRALLEHDDLSVAVAEDQWEEADHELSRRLDIIESRGAINADRRRRLEALVLRLIDGRAIEIVSRDVYLPLRETALRRVPRDERDWPTVALAMKLSAAILTAERFRINGERRGVSLLVLDGRPVAERPSWQPQPAIMVPFGPGLTVLAGEGIPGAWITEATKLDPRRFARASGLAAVSMHMTGGYAKSLREHAPQARIVIDHYYVVALATKALDEVRREHWNELHHAGQADAAAKLLSLSECLLSGR